ncbi:unnamed protein product, partial [Closterium sp. Naga37s-1]
PLVSPACLSTHPRLSHSPPHHLLLCPAPPHAPTSFTPSLQVPPSSSPSTEPTQDLSAPASSSTILHSYAQLLVSSLPQPFPPPTSSSRPTIISPLSPPKPTQADCALASSGLVLVFGEVHPDACHSSLDSLDNCFHPNHTAFQSSLPPQSFVPSSSPNLPISPPSCPTLSRSEWSGQQQHSPGVEGGAP